MPYAKISSINQDWLTDRMAYCEVNGMSSMMKMIEEGTVQGSILGPVLFALFVSPLWDIIEATTFADDNYIIGEGQSAADCIQKCKEATEKAISWFKKSGQCVNEQKTEVCIFSRNDVGANIIEINGMNIKIKHQMQVLGIIFDTKLTWYPQVMTAIEKANKVKQGLRIVSKYFTKEEMVKISTALFYSRLYYGARVWLHSGINSTLKRKLWQASSRMLQIALKDWNHERSFMDLHKEARRATPEMWSNYVHCCAMFDIVISGKPNVLLCNLMCNSLVEQRFKGLKFTRSNRLKIGMNCLSNHLVHVSRQLDFNWVMLSKTAFKIRCKELMIKNVLEI